MDKFRLPKVNKFGKIKSIQKQLIQTTQIIQQNKTKNKVYKI